MQNADSAQQAGQNKADWTRPTVHAVNFDDTLAGSDNNYFDSIFGFES